MFSPATREKSLLRMALMGPSGYGKTYSAMKIMSYLVDGQFAVIDTERDSARKYAPLPGEKADPEQGTFNFLHAGISDYNPTNFIKLINAAAEAKVEGLVIDSLSHAWAGEGGILEIKDALDKTSKNSYTNWRTITPQHNKLISTILDFPGHVIITLRAKMEYAQTKDTSGYNKVEKLGLGAIQRDDVEYEFDVVAMMNSQNAAEITKTRYSILAGQTIQKPGKELADTLRYWLGQGGDKPMTRTEFSQKCLEAFNLSEDEIGPLLAELRVSAQGFDRYNKLFDALTQHFSKAAVNE